MAIFDFDNLEDPFHQVVFLSSDKFSFLIENYGNAPVSRDNIKNINLFYVTVSTELIWHKYLKN